MGDSESEDVPPEIRNSKKQYYASIFEKYDKDGSGYIELKELREMLKSDDEIPKKIVKKIFKISDTNDDDKIDLDEFIGMIQNKKFKSIFGHYVNSYVRFILPRKKHKQIHGRSARATTPESDGYDEDDGAYEEQFSCCPPPIAMIIISIFEFACFLADELNEKDSTKYGTGITASKLIYDPYKRVQCWRFLTYMFVHIGYLHLCVNLIVQVLLGVPLEMVHGWWRILSVYFAGVVAGSLLTSITDPTSYLAGASGGVYAIITAHIACIIMNWREMTLPGAQLLIFIVITTVDIGTSIYNRYYLDINEHIGYAAHFAGGLAGLLVGIWVLRNLEITTKEKYIWWIAFVLYVVLMGIAVVLNIAWTGHFMKF